MLTKKQSALLLFIYERLKATGVSPSFEEMREALGLKSKSGIHRLITALEERGFIRRIANRARALEVLRLPENSFPTSSRDEERDRGADSKLSYVPIMGTIAVGTPVSSIQFSNRTIALPAQLLPKGDHFALDVQGDAMAGFGILNGDTAIIRRQNNAESGDIVVAYVDESVAGLQKFHHKEDDNVALESADPMYAQRVAAKRVAIQGKLVYIMRRYPE